MRSRRAFCAAACQAACGLALAGRREATPLPIVRGEVKGETVVVALAGTPLAAVGGRARVASTAGAFLVSRTGDQEAVALTGICSHEACNVTDADESAYVCPCHGSRFDPRGQVLTGPAELPLESYRASLADGTLTIALS